jgi:hypothetical protein
MVREPTSVEPVLTYTLICTVAPDVMASSELSVPTRLESVAKSASMLLAARLLYMETLPSTEALVAARTEKITALSSFAIDVIAPEVASTCSTLGLELSNPTSRERNVLLNRLLNMLERVMEVPSLK